MSFSRQIDNILTDFGKTEGWWFDSIRADQFFSATSCPESITHYFCNMMNIDASSKVLEPSAGSGGMVKVIQQYTKNITSIELNKNLYRELKSINPISLNADFLKIAINDIGFFSHILMCPPKLSDMHINHAKQFLAPDGILVAIVQKQNVEKCIDIPWKFVYNDEQINCGVIFYENCLETTGWIS